MRIMRSGQTSFAVEPWRRLVVGLVMLASLATVPTGEAWAGVGDLLVSPVRVVLEGRERSAQVTLVNKGTETSIYRVSIVNRRMLQNGAFEVIEEPGPDEKFAGELVRYAPRRITLEPDAPQTIRILLRKPSDLPAGEYRSHLLFRAVPQAIGGQSLENEETSGQGFSIKLTPIFGLTIPIIVRHGELWVDIAVTEPLLEVPANNNEPPVLQVRLVRRGERSVYGNVNVSFVDGTFGDELIGEVRGVAVYTPNDERFVRIPIKPEYASELEGRRIKVAFEEVGRPGNGAVAELSFSFK